MQELLPKGNAAQIALHLYVKPKNRTMGHLQLKQQDSAQGGDKDFVLSDVSQDELTKRRISIYSYLL